MIIENQVCTAEQAEKLKKFGIIQNYPHANWYWYTGDTGNNLDHLNILSSTNDINKDKMSYAAFTVAELGIMIPNEWEKITNKENYRHLYNYGMWEYESDGNRIYRFRHIQMDNNTQGNPPTFNFEAHCRAALLIYLLDKKLITAVDVNHRLINANN